MPPHMIDGDVRLVHEAARLLRIHEFLLFELAYREWHGATADRGTLEREFMRYLYHRQVPVWVRHFARQVVARSRQRPVRAQDYGVQPVLPPAPDRRLERARSMFLAGFYLVCFVLFTWHAI